MASHAFALQQADIFYKLTPAQLDMISALCEETSYDAGEIIFEEGTTCNELYIIVLGEVDIQINPTLVSKQPSQSVNPVTITTLRRGQSFGEIALVDRGMRSASARATQDNTQLLVIPRDRLMQLCDDHPALGYQLMKNLAADLAMKIRNSDMRIRQSLLTEKH